MQNNMRQVPCKIIKERTALCLVSCFLFLYLFLVFDVNFTGADQPIYFAYTTSLVEDGDLNPVNQIYSSGNQFDISKTYNLPDYHNHGGVIFWAPFYIYGKTMHSVAQKLHVTAFNVYNAERVARCAMSFSTVFFGFLALLCTYLFCSCFYAKRVALFSVFILFLGTPIFDCMIFEPGNANMIALFFAVLSLWFCRYASNMRERQWFTYGLFFSICLIVKSELAFQIVFLTLFFIILTTLRKTAWINGAYFIAGLIPGFALKIVNDFIKYGTLHAGELGVFNFRDFYFFEQLFSSYRGFFYTSPIFYLCLCGFVILLSSLVKNFDLKNEKKLQEAFLIILALYLFVKIFLLSFRYAWGGGTPGARILLTEFPVFALLYARLFSVRYKSILLVFIVLSLAFIFWNIIAVFEFFKGIDIGYITKAPALSTRIPGFIEGLKNLCQPRDLDLKLRFCLPLAFLGLAAILFVITTWRPIPFSHWYNTTNQNQDWLLSYRKLVLLTACLYISYTLVTVLNVCNNQRNVNRLKQEGFFAYATIIGPREFEKRENVGSFNEMIRYYTARGNQHKVERIKRLKRELYNE